MAKRDLILNNFRWKLLSLILAVIVWATLWISFHSGEGIGLRLPESLGPSFSTRLFVNHTITISKSATDDREFQILPREVDVTVSGRSTDLKQLLEKEVQAAVNLNDAKSSNSNLPIQVMVPKGIRVERIYPREVHVRLVKP